MQIKIPSRLLLVPALLSLAVNPGRAQVDVGEQAKDHELTVVMNGDGRARLSQFTGHPVLIATWMRVSMGNGALDKAVRLHEKLASRGLVTILMNLDPGPPSDTEVASWILRHHGSTTAIITQAFAYPGRPETAGQPPYLALIGVDGTLRAAGSAGSLGGGIDKLVEEELKKRQSGWGQSAVLKKARSLLHGKNDLAGASRLARDPKTSPEDARVLDAEIADRFALWKTSVSSLIEAGEWGRAQRAAADLVKAAGDMPDRAAEAREIEARFATEEAGRELAVDKKIAGVLDRIRQGPPKADMVAPLRGIAKQSAGTTAGKRAERVAAWVAEALKS
jgi:hypothetical protein